MFDFVRASSVAFLTSIWHYFSPAPTFELVAIVTLAYHECPVACSSPARDQNKSSELHQLLTLWHWHVCTWTTLLPWESCSHPHTFLIVTLTGFFYWLALLGRCTVVLSRSPITFSAVCQRYSQPHRHMDVDIMLNIMLTSMILTSINRHHCVPVHDHFSSFQREWETLSCEL